MTNHFILKFMYCNYEINYLLISITKDLNVTFNIDQQVFKVHVFQATVD